MPERDESANTDTVRYQKPKILIVDLPISVSDRLRAAGYNVLPGTFGRPFNVELGNNYVPVIAEPSVPNYSEQEIVVIDLTAPDADEGPESQNVIVPGVLGCFAKASTGIIDPRPHVMANLRTASDRIIRAGGVFIVFAEPRTQPKLVAARTDGYGHLDDVRQLDFDNWSFLSMLSRDHLTIGRDYGFEITPMKEGVGPFASFLH